jgi:glycosyltransferase involved in cell wall biosynthesis
MKPDRDEASRPRYSAVIPVFDEVENLPRLREAMLRVLDALGEPYELLFVDDGSTDGGERLLDEYRASHPSIRVVRLDRNWGLTSALDAGFRSARGEVLVTLDADLQSDPEDIPMLLEKLSEYDMVCGWRKDRRDPFLKRISSRIANAVRNRLTGENIHDTCCPLKVFRAEILDRVRLFDGFHRFLPTLARWEGFRVAEVPVRHHPRIAGSSKYGIRNRLGKGISDLRAIRWMKRNRLRYRKTILD